MKRKEDDIISAYQRNDVCLQIIREREGGGEGERKRICSLLQ